MPMAEVATLADFEFDLEPDDHRYMFNGSEVPACTRVLELARKSLGGIPTKVLVAAAKRGTTVHKAIELFLKDDLDKRTLNLEIRIRLDRWCRFMDFHRFEPLVLPVANYMHGFVGGQLIETPMVHPLWRFGVTPDVGICLVEGSISAVEIKATSSHNDATALQMAAQQETINHFFLKYGYKVEERWSVRLTSDEKPDVRRYKDKSDWAAYLSFLNVHNWRKVHKIA